MLHPCTAAPVVNIAHLRKFHELHQSIVQQRNGLSIFRNDMIADVTAENSDGGASQE
jgi:hypothetical protein